ncbi:MAG: matrixin family metalloprotease, partial [Myxococcales bacterium]
LPSLAWGWEHKRDASGHPVRFAEREITFHLPAKLPPGVTAAEVRDAAERSLRAWSEVSGLRLRFEQGPANARAGYDAAGTNRNDILFVESGWSYDENAVAVTLVTVDRDRHHIIDADILLNADKRRFKKLADGTRAAPVYDDLQNTLTHELGHALGLAHTHDAEATMFADTQRGETAKRELSADDIDGIRALYLTGEQAPPELALSCGASGATAAAPLAWALLVPLPWVRRRLRRDAFSETLP